MSTNDREIDEIVARRFRGELITRSESERVMNQFRASSADLPLYNPQSPIAPEYLSGTVPGMMSWPPSVFKDEP